MVEIVLRSTTIDDAAKFAELRNGEDTYHWFYANRQFNEVEVRDWLRDWVKSEDRNKDQIYMAEVDGEIIGTCSIHGIDRATGRAEVGRIIVAEDQRGKGLGTLMLKKLISEAFLCFTSLYANIKTNNISSQKIFEKAGFVVKDIKPNTGYYYELERGMWSQIISNANR